MDNGPGEEERGPYLPSGYALDETDPVVVVLRRPDGSGVANFGEAPQAEVRRITLLGRTVNKGANKTPNFRESDLCVPTNFRLFAYCVVSGATRREGRHTGIR